MAHINQNILLQATDVPNVFYEAPDNTLWTLALTCPDEHLQEQDKEYLHWLM
jgi:hypothetical protein